MSEAKGQQEPSMEEILASIRRIISEDGDGAAPGAAPTAARSGDDDVLVLTEEVDSDGAPTLAAAPPVSESSRNEPEAHQPLVQEDLENEPSVTLSDPEPPPADPASATEMPHAVPEFGRRLISDTTAAASLSALSELVSRTHREPNIESLPLGNANRTLEDITRELLRPILKNWLDENLPELVERIVREEIGRLALDAQRR
jgi:cell pole-organizing protein PopZ